MKKRYKTRYIIELSLDQLKEIASQNGNKIPFEYQIGAYYEMDKVAIGEMANIMRLIENGYLKRCEKAAVLKKLDDLKLNAAERKSYERAIKKLKKILQADSVKN